MKKSIKGKENRIFFDNKVVCIKKCKHGTFAFFKTDTFVGRSLNLYGEWTEPEIGLLDNFISPGSIVVDVGASIGTHTVFFAKKTAHNGFVYSFEPQRLSFNLLCTNLALNNLTNVKPFQQAVGKMSKMIVVPVLDPRAVQNFGSLSLKPKHTSGERVWLTTIDSLKLKRCDLIKIDVEGMEADVVEGASQTIKKFRPILYVENNRKEGNKKLILRFNKLGYSCFWHILDYFNPKNFFANPKNVFSGFQPEANVICIPKETLINLPNLIKVKSPNDSWQNVVNRLQLSK